MHTKWCTVGHHADIRVSNHFSKIFFEGMVLKVLRTRNFILLGLIQYLLRIKFYVPSKEELLKIIPVLSNFSIQKHVMMYALLCQGISQTIFRRTGFCRAIHAEQRSFEFMAISFSKFFLCTCKDRWFINSSVFVEYPYSIARELFRYTALRYSRM